MVRWVTRKDCLLIKKFRAFFYQTHIRTVEVSSQVAEKAADLRAFHNIQTADAIQIATALSTKAAYFLTNDKDLPVMPGISTLVLDDLKAQSISDSPETDS